MSVYLDANVVVALLTEDPLATRAQSLLRKTNDLLIVSDYTAAEFAAVVARHVRMDGILKETAQILFQNFDDWTMRHTEAVEVTPSDLRSAEAYMRRLDINLRTPDAIHLAICSRIGAVLATFDVKMTEAAKALGIPVAVV
jgi:predicted nucleic acid-binding protein